MVDVLKRRPTRLQGADWLRMRKERHFKLVCISMSRNGNYRADVLDEYSNHYYHWLNDQEVSKLKSSEYFKNNKIYSSEEFCENDFALSKRLVANLINQ